MSHLTVRVLGRHNGVQQYSTFCPLNLLRKKSAGANYAQNESQQNHPQIISVVISNAAHSLIEKITMYNRP